MLRKLLLSATAVVMAIGLSGCGKSPQEKEREANAKAQKMQTLAESLNEDGINVFPISSYEDLAADRSSRNIDDMSAEELESAVTRLQQYVTLGNEIISIGKSDGMYLKNESELRRTIKVASKALSEAKAKLAKKLADEDAA